mmetsp:Transcript_22417/g.47024  ORF Transcript_22417/g.47024 Transcript_22417/m.47024 type:complete len:95 (+) Transcript_22417:180-464(+)
MRFAPTSADRHISTTFVITPFTRRAVLAAKSSVLRVLSASGEPAEAALRPMRDADSSLNDAIFASGHGAVAAMGLNGLVRGVHYGGSAAGTGTG